MFITVTRSGGSSTLRLAAAAVAHITAMDGGTVLHLLSGDHLRVDDAADDVEARICQILVPELAVCEAVASAPAATRADLDELLAQRFGELAAALGLRTLTAVRIPIDDALEERAAIATEQAGIITPIEAVEQHVERVTRRGRGRRA